MNIAEAAGLLVIAVCVLILLLCSFVNDLYIQVNHFVILFLVLTAAIVLMIYLFDPQEFIRWDLLVHYNTLKQMQSKGLDYVLHESEYKNLVFINTYFYLISLIGNFRLLSVFPVIADFLAALYMIQDQLRLRYGYSVPVRDCAYTAVLWFFSFGFMLSVSGIRCVFAMAVGMLALYLEYYKKQHRLLALFLYAVCLMTHSLGVAIVMIRILLLIRNKIILLIAMIGACLMFSPMLSVLSALISNSYIRYLFENVGKYWSSFGTIQWFLRVSNSDRTVFLCYLLICVFNLYMLWRIRRKEGTGLQRGRYSDEKKRAWNLISTIAVLYVTGMFNALFTERLTYILAYSFPITVPFYLQSIRRTWKDTVLNLFMLFIFLWLFFFDDLYIFIVNFTGVYFLDL